MIPPHTLTKMLTQGELSYSERQQLGLVNHPPLKYQDIINHLVNVIDQQGFFPYRRSELAREGGTIEQLGPSQYVYVYQRYYADRPVVAETREVTFCSAREAAEHYVKWDLCLPEQRLCGIRVMK